MGRPPRVVDVPDLVARYASGASIQQVARETGLSFCLVRSRLLSAGVQLRTAWERNRHPVRTEPSPDTAYIVGVYLGDGYAWEAKRRGGAPGYKVGLSTVDEEFAIAFADALRRIGVHVPPFRRKAYPDRPNAKEAWVVEVCSRNLYEWLTGLSSARIHNIACHSRDCLWAFVRGLYDSEGSFSTSGNGPDARMANADRPTMRFVHQLLSSNGFHPGFYNYKTPGRREMFHVVLSRKAEVRRFLQLVSPSIPRKGGPAV